MTPATYDFTIWRGTSGPTQGLKFRLQDSLGAAIPFDDVRISIYQKNTFIMRVAVSDINPKLTVTDAPTGELTWAPSATDTRLIPLGAKATYEVEIRNGAEEVVYLTGTITGAGGINDDESDPS